MLKLSSDPLPIKLKDLDLTIKRNVLTVLIQNVDFKEDIEDKDCKQCIFIKLPVECGDLDLLKSLFQLLIKAHSEKMESSYLPISFDNAFMIPALNHIYHCLDKTTMLCRDTVHFTVHQTHMQCHDMPMSPLHMAAKNGNIEMIRLFVKNIKYIDYVNTKYNDGLSPIEAAAFNHHFEIVNRYFDAIDYRCRIPNHCR